MGRYPAASSGAGVTPGSVDATALTNLMRAGGWLPLDGSGRPGIDQTVLDRQASASLAPTSGALALCGGIVAPKGRIIHSLSFALSLAPVTPTNAWAGIVRRVDGVLVAVTADVGGFANGFQSIDFAATYTPGQDEELYAGLMQTAATPGTYRCGSFNTLTNGLAPAFAGYSTLGLTGPPAVGTVMDGAGVGGGFGNVPWCMIA